MKYCVTIELESKAEAHEIIERLPTERPVYIRKEERYEYRFQSRRRKTNICTRR